MILEMTCQPMNEKGAMHDAVDSAEHKDSMSETVQSICVGACTESGTAYFRSWPVYVFSEWKADRGRLSDTGLQ